MHKLLGLTCACMLSFLQRNDLFVRKLLYMKQPKETRQWCLQHKDNSDTHDEQGNHDSGDPESPKSDYHESVSADKGGMPTGTELLTNILSPFSRPPQTLSRPCPVGLDPLSGLFALLPRLCFQFLPNSALQLESFQTGCC